MWWIFVHLFCFHLYIYIYETSYTCFCVSITSKSTFLPYDVQRVWIETWFHGNAPLKNNKTKKKPKIGNIFLNPSNICILCVCTNANFIVEEISSPNRNLVKIKVSTENIDGSISRRNLTFSSHFGFPYRRTKNHTKANKNNCLFIQRNWRKTTWRRKKIFVRIAYAKKWATKQKYALRIKK